MSYGYHGKILHVDLTAGTLEVEEPEESFYRKYMGGSAMGTYYLVKHTPPGSLASPLRPSPPSPTWRATRSLGGSGRQNSRPPASTAS